jgi:predicted transcriptional regulator
MQINQLIYISNIVTEIDKIEGVQTVQNFQILNLSDVNHGYSKYQYSIKDATRNNIIYPSADPCIFEIKFPENDIKGRVVNV